MTSDQAALRRFLAAHADNFEPMDVVLAKALAEAVPWTPQQERAALLLIKRYGGQVDELPVDDERRLISCLNGEFVIRFRYEPWLVGAIKQWPYRPKPRWDAKRRVWRVGKTISEVEALEQFGECFGFEWDENARKDADEIRRKADRRLKLSEAEDFAVGVKDLGVELRPFQRVAVQYFLETHRCIIADEMGLGKTIEALAGLQAARAFPAIIVPPASLKLNWEREVRKVLPDKTVQVVKNGKDTLVGADVTVINYDLLPKRLNDLRSLKAQAVVFDESHYLKSRQAQRTKAAKELVEGVPRIAMLTGTPVLNEPIELESQLDILGRLDEFGGSWDFRMRYCDAKQVYHSSSVKAWDFTGSSHLDELNERLRQICYIRRKKEQVLKELPPKQRTIIPLRLDNQDEYEDAEEDFFEWLRQHGKDSSRVVEALGKLEVLRQLAAKGKIKQVVAWVHDTLQEVDKLVIFAYHREIQDALATAFPGSARVHGDDPPQVRQANVDRFQNDPSCKLIVCSLLAGGVGLTLTAASNVAFVQTGWTPSLQDQAEDRLHRIGQLQSVNAIYFMAEGTVEERIWHTLERKREIVNHVHDGVDTTQARLSVEHDVLDSMLEGVSA